MSNIEFVAGQESHSSKWGKFFIKGLEKWQVKEDGSYGKHSSYTEYQCNDIPENTVFSVFEQSGDKMGTNAFEFSICVTTDSETGAIDSAYGDGKIAGNFKVIATANTATKAPRLMNWWIDQRPANADPIAFAEHCAEHINKRGVKDCPPMVNLVSPEERDRLLLQDEIAKLFDRFGAEKVKQAIANA